MAKKLFVSEDARVVHGSSEALVELDGSDGIDKIVIVPMDDCIIEVVWSSKHHRIVGIVKECPGVD